MIIAIIDIGIFKKKIHLQFNMSLITPPIIGPITPEVVKPAEVMPNHLPLSLGFHKDAIRIQIVPITPANPIPWTALEKIKKNIELLNPHKKVENVKIISEIKITFFAPIMSFNFPTMGTHIADVKEKAEKIQA